MKKRISTIVVSLIIALVIFPNCRRTEHDKLTYFGVWAIMESNSEIVKDGHLKITTSINDLDYHELITDINTNQILSDKTWTINADSSENGDGRSLYTKDCNLNFYDENTIYKTLICKHIDTIENTDTILITTLKKRYRGDWQIYKKENRHDNTKIVFTINHTDIDTCYAKYTSNGFVEDTVILNDSWGGGEWTYEVSDFEKFKGSLKLSGTFQNGNEYGFENLVLKRQ
ncbi:MAG: hypothetical protein IKP45_02315 [Bacteroidales bacterium]|nr:hypothetical protein [Bacteroidales bacterium]